MVKSVGSNEEFIEDIFGAVEFEFTEHFGQKWTPEIYKLFQNALDTTRTVAIALDEAAASKAAGSYAGRRVRRLTNLVDKQMVARRIRRRPGGFKRRAGSMVWMGFRTGETPINLDTDVSFELVPPAANGERIRQTMKVLKIVGSLNVTNESSVVVATPWAMCFQVVTFANDQVAIEDQVDPLSTDSDDFSRKGILWWNTWGGRFGQSAPSNFDEFVDVVPINIKTNRLLNRNHGLELRVAAATASRLKVFVNLRVLVWIP